MARGHIYRRRLANGGLSSWHAVIDAGTKQGRRRQLTRSFPTRGQAQDWLAQQSQHRDQDAPTLGEYLTDWLSRQHHLRASTRVSYGGHIRRFLIPSLGDVRLAMVTTADLDRAHHQWRTQGASEALVHRIHATLSSALTAAVRQGLVGANPATTIRMQRTPEFIATVWTVHEAARFLAHTTGDDLAGLWRLALVTGLRRGELVGLQWRDLDLERGVVQIRRTRTVVAGQVVSGPPKSSRGRRSIVLDPRTVAVLTRHRTAWELASLASGVAWTDATLVFTREPGGDGLDPRWVSRRFRDLCAEAEVPVIRLHDLRHTSASLGIATGESLMQVSTRLGHSSVATTADLYLQVPEEVAQLAVRRLADLLDTGTADGAA